MSSLEQTQRHLGVKDVAGETALTHGTRQTWPDCPRPCPAGGRPAGNAPAHRTARPRRARGWLDCVWFWVLICEYVLRPAAAGPGDIPKGADHGYSQRH